MKRSQIFPMPEYFDSYINQCDDVELLDAIQTSLGELENIPVEKWQALGNKAYAPGKWTIKDIVQHLTDTTRIFSYRALAFARDERQSIPSFSEDEYATAAAANDRDLDDLVNDLKLAYRSFESLYESFTPAVLNKTGMGFKGPYSVAAIGFIVPGHLRWHLRVLEEKYYPLLVVKY